MIRAVLFDMDGILYDSEYFYMQGTVRQMRKYGYTGPEENIYQIIGTTIEDTYHILYRLLDGSVPYETLKKNNDYYFGVLHPIDYKKIMFPKVKETLILLKEDGKKLAVCSSSPKKTIDDSLKAMEIESLFDFVESAEHLKHSKPYPDVYLKAAKALKTDPQECAVYEDSAAGIEAGKRAGMKTYARRDTRFHQDQTHADRIVKDIQELYRQIRKEDTDAGSH